MHQSVPDKPWALAQAEEIAKHCLENEVITRAAKCDRAIKRSERMGREIRVRCPRCRGMATATAKTFTCPTCGIARFI